MTISRYVKIGLFFLSLGAAGTGYVVMSSDGINSWNTTTYEVLLDDATGVTTNSDVLLAGVLVGRIQSIKLHNGHALLRINFLDSVNIHSDASISKQSSSLLGSSLLVLNQGSESAPLIGAGGRITAVGGGGDMGAAVSSMKDLSGQLSGLLAEFQTRQMELMAISLETFNSLAKKMDARSDAELARISRILESSARITERFDAMLDAKDGDISASAYEVRGALENLKAISAEIRSGQGSLGSAIYDDELYRKLTATAAKTEEAAGKLSEALTSVNSLVKNADGIVSKANGLGVSVDSGARWDLLSATGRGNASIRLEPAKGDRWYRIGVSSSPDGVASKTVTETTTGGVTTKEETTETDYGVAFDAEIARRFWLFTLRGGVYESTAGVGLDFQPLPWISLSGQVFDFSSGGMPNLRGTATVYPFFNPSSDKPWNWLYLSGGVDAALDAARRDYYLGGGIRFTDDEVRGLVGLATLGSK